MGAINQAFNQAAGAVAGAALAIKHAKESEESKMYAADNSALIARNQSRTADAEYNEERDEAGKEGGLIQKLSEATVNREEAEKAYNKAVNRKNGSPVARLEKMSELKAAQKAENELLNKYKALEDLRDRADEQRMYAAKATEIALKAKEKYEKRWGDK